MLSHVDISFSWSLVLFVAFFLFRYVRLIVNLYAFWTFRPIPIPDEPSYTPDDVTVLIPTIGDDDKTLPRTIRTCLQTDPYEIILVTIDSNFKRVEAIAKAISRKKIRVLSVPKANKRKQLCAGFPHVKTRITILADDDVIWPRTLLPWILAPFESPRMGGVGTNQRLWRDPTVSFFSWQYFWDFHGAIYLERRNFDIAACTHMDGGLPCLSGRTVAYRTCILQEEDFKEGFTNEFWGKCILNTDDDNFLTRWMVSHDWDTYVQYHRECEVQTTLEIGKKFLKQCYRWSRSNFRSNYKSLVEERHVWRRQPWSTYAVQQTTFTAHAVIWDWGLTCWFWSLISNWPEHSRNLALALWICWCFGFAKFSKLVQHYVRYPLDVFLFWEQIAFGQFHSVFIKIKAGFTLNETSWGSREGADTDNSLRMERPPDYHSLLEDSLIDDPI